MKERILPLLLCAALLPAVAGCDLLRTLAGRPTSKDIAAKEQQLRRMEEEHKAKIDSLMAVEKKLREELAASEQAQKEAESARYIVVVGSFRDKENAGKLSELLRENGYTPYDLTLSGGYYAIGTAPSPTFDAAYEKLLELKTKQFCPPDIWILKK